MGIRCLLQISLLFGLLGYGTGYTYAQTLQILDQSSLQPIEQVAVYTADETFSAYTNANGEVIIVDIESAEKLFFQHPSYVNDEYTLAQLKKFQYKVVLIPDEISLPEMVVTADRIEEKASKTLNKVDVIQSNEILNNSPQTTADLLSSSGNVFVQKSQAGGGSPVIRGFEANKVLLVVDGIRMNNAIYRGGHLQNVISIDPAVLDRVEVVYGPGSVMYGSDALGGVMHFVTKSPVLSDTDKMRVQGNLTTRSSSVNNERYFHGDISLGAKKWGLLSGVSVSDFGDLKIGQRRSGKYPDWGVQPYYFDEVEDTVVANAQPHLIHGSGYHQLDFINKITFQASDKWSFTLNHQSSISSDIPRSDRLNDLTNSADPTSLKFRDWYYHPQLRHLVAFQTKGKIEKKFADQLQFTAAYQRIKEGRVQRRLGKDIQDSGEEQLHIGSLNLDLVKSWMGQDRLQYGMEYTFNDIQSSAYERDVTTVDAPAPVVSRYPDGKNRMNSLAAFAQYRRLLGDKITLRAGVRLSYIGLDANYEDASLFETPLNNIQYNNVGLTFNVGMMYEPKESTKLSWNLSSGFRSPNLDDVAKIFDPVPNIVVVPNGNVSPEYAYNLEWGLEQKVGEKFRFGVNTYFTFIDEVIRRNPITLDGDVDSIEYNGDMSATYANVNSGQAYIAGVSFNAVLRPFKNFLISKKLNYTYGWDITNNNPLGHIPPMFGSLELEYIHPWVEGAFYVNYNAAKKLKQYSPYSEDKLNEATEDGTPRWATLNLRAVIKPHSSVKIITSIENLLDVHYRPFSSGISAPGRNFRLALNWNFANKT